MNVRFQGLWRGLECAGWVLCALLVTADWSLPGSTRGYALQPWVPSLWTANGDMNEHHPHAMVIEDVDGLHVVSVTAEKQKELHGRCAAGEMRYVGHAGTINRHEQWGLFSGCIVRTQVVCWVQGTPIAEWLNPAMVRSQFAEVEALRGDTKWPGMAAALRKPEGAWTSTIVPAACVHDGFMILMLGRLVWRGCLRLEGWVRRGVAPKPDDATGLLGSEVLAYPIHEKLD